MREFQNVVQEAVAFSSYGKLTFWPSCLTPVETPGEPSNGAADVPHADMSTPDRAALVGSGTLPSYDTLMEEYLALGLRLSDGKIRGPGGLAERTGIHYSTLRAKLMKYHVAHGRRLTP